jgi:pimeloyl-ACP methyl ester carboxylesterase
MLDDTAALLAHIGIEQADLFGYSIGAGVALQVAIRHSRLVRKLVLAAVTYNSGGMHPGLLENIRNLQPEMMVGTPFYAEYARLAPRPQDWPILVERVKDLDKQPQD